MTDRKILVTRSSLPPIEEYVEEIKTIWDSHWLTNMGAIHQRLNIALNEYLGTTNLSLFVNGHMALELTMQAMGLTGEVITTPFTFASTTHAIVRNNLMPVFCDIDPIDFTMDTSCLEQLITEKTSAILPVHVYGNICKIEEIDRIAKKHGLKVLYDAAHAFGEKYLGKGVGNFGDASMFSFHATKVFNTIEGGAVAYKDLELKSKLYNLMNFGIQSEEVVSGVGSNAKMNEFQAAMGICNLRHIDEEIEKRKQVFERYMSHLEGVTGIGTKRNDPHVVSNYSYCPVTFDKGKYGFDRNEISNMLSRKGIFSRKYFYPLTSDFDCYKDRFDSSLTPVARSVSQKVLTLPIYSGLSMDDVDMICKIILEKG